LLDFDDGHTQRFCDCGQGVMSKGHASGYKLLYAVFASRMVSAVEGSELPSVMTRQGLGRA
jgi:hypothetical protein